MKHPLAQYPVLNGWQGSHIILIIYPGIYRKILLSKQYPAAGQYPVLIGRKAIAAGALNIGTGKIYINGTGFTAVAVKSCSNELDFCFLLKNGNRFKVFSLPNYYISMRRIHNRLVRLQNLWKPACIWSSTGSLLKHNPRSLFQERGYGALKE